MSTDKWWQQMRTVEAQRGTHSPGGFTWSEGWRPVVAEVCIHQIGWTHTMVCHDASTRNIILAIIISKRQRITLRLLYAMSRPSVCLSVCCLSVVCLSVTLVHPTQAVELFGNFFSPYDSPGTLLFWCQKSLVGDAPFPLKFAFKVTHPLSNSEISTNIGS